LNDLVVRTFAISDRSIKNITPIISLLNSPGLLKDGRECVWSLIMEKAPTYDQFSSVYKWKGDWIYLTKYLLIEKSLNAKEMFCEAAKNSIEAFVLIYDYLVDNCQSVIFEEDFLNSVLFLPIKNENSLTIIKYINYLLQINNKYKSYILDHIKLKLMRQVDNILCMIDKKVDYDFSEIQASINIIKDLGCFADIKPMLEEKSCINAIFKSEIQKIINE